MNQKVLPWPTSLVTPISPPMSSTSWREMARPRPVPPYRRVVPASAWENDSNTGAWSLSAIPIPVSTTWKRMIVDVASPPAMVSSSTTSPEGVNFTALPTRLVTIWRRRPGSPRSTAGISTGTLHTSSRPLAWAGWENMPATSSTRPRRSKSMLSRSRRPASILEKSRMSLRMLSRASPDACTVWANSRCSTPRSVSSSNEVMPSTPFIGVRISWLMLARNSDLSCDAASAWSRADARAASASLRSVMSCTNALKHPRVAPF